MSSEPPTAAISGAQPGGGATCVKCGAALHPAASICWLCFAPTAETKMRAGSAASRSLEPIPEVSRFSLASLLMFMTLACVILGVFTKWPGLGVPLAILSLVVWGRTVNIIRQRAKKGETVAPLQRVLIFMSSFAGTLTVIALLIVTGAAALGTVCATMFSVADARALHGQLEARSRFWAVCLCLEAYFAESTLARLQD